MRKILVLLMVVMFAAGNMYAQQDNLKGKSLKEIEKEQKRAAKEAKKAAEEAEENRLFEQAVQALDGRDFVIEAERVEFKRGNYVYVTPSTNFVKVEGDNATVQLSFNVPASGPNGIGGITLDGKTSDVKIVKDKKGNVTYEMFVQGAALSARLVVKVTNGTSRCTATVYPNFNSNRVSFSGRLYPSSESTIFKGRSI